MSRFDRYMLSQLLILFSFFALVLVSVYWVNRAVVLFDTLIANGQSVWVFLEFSALSLPKVIYLVFPMSVFAASIYVTNRLSSESELTVMQATGFSPQRLARPVFFFGFVVMLMMSILTHVLVPVSADRLTHRQIEVSENITAQLLTEGTFLHPTSGVTFYAREITLDGILRDVFLSDRRDPLDVSIYTAAEAYLISTDTGPKLIMVDGLSQFYSGSDNRLFTTNFADFTYDISGLLGKPKTRIERVEFVSTGELLRDPLGVSQKVGKSYGEVQEELHGRFNRPLMIVSTALIGFSTLLLGGFSRFGVWRQIGIAFVLLILVELSRSATLDTVRSNGSFWPLIYLPSLLGFIISAALLWLAAHPVRLRWRVSV